MNEPLVCWVGLLVLGFYAYLTGRLESQRKLAKCLEACSGTRCGITFQWYKWYPFQWYNMATAFLLWFFVRSMQDIIIFDYIKFHFLDWDIFKAGCDGMDDATWTKATTLHEIGIPSFLRVISLLSPIFATVAFGINMYHSHKFIKACPQASIEKYPQWVSSPENILPLLVIAMPTVFSVMALRATIRQWAIMTCSAFAGMHRSDPTMPWKEIKNLELATYQQDLAVAAAFQFITCGLFGFACRLALKGITNRATEDKKKDSGKLLHAAILGIHAFVVIGLVKSIVSMGLAAMSTNPDMMATVGHVQLIMTTKVDPMFLFATILCVLNMFILGSMDEVQNVMGNVNVKFNATRALLLIGQGQMMALQSVTNGSEKYGMIMNCLHKVPGLSNLSWDFNMEEARLLHSSLLCLECMLVAYVNTRVWRPRALNNELTEELLTNETRPAPKPTSFAGPTKRGEEPISNTV